MQVLAIRTPSIINNLTTAISPGLPIGLAYVLSAIEDLVEIEAIDPIAEKPSISDVTPFRNGTSILGLTPEETLRRVHKSPDLCLISSMFSMEWPVTRLLIEGIRKQYPRCFIVGGGEHFNAAAEYSLRTSPLDACVLGEGEATIREFVERLWTERSLPLDVPGTVVRNPDTGAIIENRRRDRIRQVESIRYPAWHLFNVEGFLDSGISNTGNGLQGYRAMPIAASRGCPYRCTFCSNPDMWGVLWRARAPQDVIEEMKVWMGRYGATHFDFCDLTAIVKKSWIVDFCERLIREHLAITWGLPSGTRSEALDYDVLRLLKASGCNDLDYAPESGSEYVLGVMKKQINKKKMLASMRDCHRVGIKSKANIILGYPEEKRRHVLETYGFIVQMARVGVDDILVTSLSAYPGSAVFEQLRRAGRVRLDEEYFLDLSSQGSLNVSPCWSEHYSRIEQYLFKMGGFALFYICSLLFRPGRLLTLAADLVDGEGSTRLSMGLINLSRRLKNRTIAMLRPAVH